MREIVDGYTEEYAPKAAEFFTNIMGNVAEKWRSFTKKDEDKGLEELAMEYAWSEIASSTKDFDEERALGSGASGAVYKGTLSEGIDVAVKVIETVVGSEFTSEVRLLSKCRHPNVVMLLGFAIEPKTYSAEDPSVENPRRRALVYELLPGGDVHNRLQKPKKPYRWQERLKTAIDTARGLAHLHKHRPEIFHRDIKSPNILFDAAGVAKIADFGLACVPKKKTARNMLVAEAGGTPGYCDPLYAMSGVVTEANEVYSFGWTVIELMTARPPAYATDDGNIFFLSDHLFAGDGAKQRLLDLLDKAAMWPTRVARELADIALRCVYEHDLRPSFLELTGLLQELQEGTALNKRIVQPSEIAKASNPAPRALVYKKVGDNLVLAAEDTPAEQAAGSGDGASRSREAGADPPVVYRRVGDQLVPVPRAEGVAQEPAAGASVEASQSRDPSSPSNALSDAAPGQCVYRKVGDQTVLRPAEAPAQCVAAGPPQRPDGAVHVVDAPAGQVSYMMVGDQVVQVHAAAPAQCVAVGPPQRPDGAVHVVDTPSGQVSYMMVGDQFVQVPGDPRCSSSPQQQSREVGSPQVPTPPEASYVPAAAVHAAVQAASQGAHPQGWNTAVYPQDSFTQGAVVDGRPAQQRIIMAPGMAVAQHLSGGRPSGFVQPQMMVQTAMVQMPPRPPYGTVVAGHPCGHPGGHPGVPQPNHTSGHWQGGPVVEPRVHISARPH